MTTDKQYRVVHTELCECESCQDGLIPAEVHVMDSLQRQLVDEVKRFARANYEMDGWDFIVECCEDEDILKLIGGAKTSKSAIRNAAMVLKVQDERRKDAEAEIW